MQFRSFRLTFGTEIVIRYIARECVRLRPTPPAVGYFLYYTQDGDRGMHILFNKKIVGVYYILCVLWYAYYEEVQSIEIPTIIHL